MKWIERAFLIHLLITTGTLAIGFAAGGALTLAFFTVLLGGLWFFANLRGVRGLETPLLLLAALGAAATFYFIPMPPVAALLAVVAALGTWDLDFFLQRLRMVERLDNDALLGRDHLRRLGIAEGAGLLLGLLALSIQLRMGVGMILLAILFAAIGISFAIRYLRDEITP